VLKSSPKYYTTICYLTATRSFSITKSIGDSGDAFSALEREANKVGLKVNESKTKYVNAAGNNRTIAMLGRAWLLATNL
jgi:hypothetical protein